MTKRYSIGFDIGGTFTDFVMLDRETSDLWVYKHLSTPHDPAEGALKGLEAIVANSGADFADVDEVIHGTTIVTNAVITRNGAKAALLTTRGFRDVIETASEQRYDIHDLFLTFPAPLVPRHLRFEIDERIAATGEIVTPADEADIRAALQAATDAGCTVVAVCFLHAFTNDAHERAVAAIAAREFPDLLISLSSETSPTIREYERATTTTANAYVQPLVGPYVTRIETALAARGFTGRFRLMQSSGGLATAQMATRFPVRLLESGPAGGAIAAAAFGKSAGRDDVIAFDMGGTTAKFAMIVDGAPEVAPFIEAGREDRFKPGSGLPIRTSVVDMIEIGAGGGSIAHLDALGLLKVGPQSAGADPGPACYGRGGTAPTVTDASLLLGHLDADAFLGGRMILDRAKAEAAFQPLADAMGISVLEAAWGVFSIVCETMASAARVHIVGKGYDPRRFAMIAFGGAGPSHAVEVARLIGAPTVIVPPASGVASALGFLAGAISNEATRSHPTTLDKADFAAIGSLLADLEADGRQFLDEAGIDADAVTVTRHVELRLVGQIHDIKVALPAGRLGPQSIPAIREAFVAEYTRLYGREPSALGLEASNWSVICAAPSRSAAFARIVREAPEGVTKPVRQLYFPGAGLVEAPVHDRYGLREGDTIAGPAVVLEDESATILPPGSHATADAAGNLVIQLPERVASVAGRETSLEDDPIALEILWSRLVTIAEECWTTVIRTAFSLIIGECQDFACEILDKDGNSLAHSPRAMPIFNITLMTAVQEMLKTHPPQSLKEGDILITNDPWACAGHLFDIAIAMPVFRDGEVVAFVGAVGHVSDIGGTKDRMRAREMYEEGLYIPPLKFAKAGVPNDDLVAMIAGNVRNPDQVLGDLDALVASATLGSARLHDFFDEYGLDVFEQLVTIVQDRAEAAMRAAIEAIPDGTYENAINVTSAGHKVTLPVQVDVKGDTLSVRYDGAPAQLPFGGLNCTMRYTEAETQFAIKCLLSPHVPACAGAYRPLSITAPAGSMLNCDRPVAVGLRHITGAYICGDFFQALGGALPEKVRAFTGLPTNISFFGNEGTRFFNEHVFMGGGQGASQMRDGKSAMLWPTSAATGSVEIMETRAPVLMIEKMLVTDSGGAGRTRGGLGQRVRFRRLRPDAANVNSNFYPKGVGLIADGLFGGRNGVPARCTRYDVDTGTETSLGEGAMVPLTALDVQVEVQVGGGAGFGHPAERPIEAVQLDLDGDYISAEAARAIYRVVIGADGRIDPEASAALRESSLVEQEMSSK
ncbi:hydantoinase B/oxoprolinase family protein [Acuticoccus kandeliae]|uniref:hydantoinase B/oxoprolinase family protein n=1 Tax=Acuticoccus kandeliae TaxID=2073160 RepID=UPI001FE927C4|nr:hydantoinase B/oxoprolinase family protein [Acuticoccus kandeliae]